MPQVSLEKMLSFVSPSITRAVREAAAAYERAGVPAMLVGGLAVGAHGYVRATRDVDFLVGDEAFEAKGIIVSFVPGIPMMIGDVPIDSIPLNDEYGQTLADGFDYAHDEDGIMVAPIEVIFLMKLASRRRKDLMDLTELIRVGATVGHDIRGFITQNAPALVERLDVVEGAADEEE